MTPFPRILEGMRCRLENPNGPRWYGAGAECLKQWPQRAIGFSLSVIEPQRSCLKYLVGHRPLPASNPEGCLQKGAVLWKWEV